MSVLGSPALRQGGWNRADYLLREGVLGQGFAISQGHYQNHNFVTTRKSSILHLMLGNMARIWKPCQGVTGAQSLFQTRSVL